MPKYADNNSLTQMGTDAFTDQRRLSVRICGGAICAHLRGQETFVQLLRSQAYLKP